MQVVTLASGENKTVDFVGDDQTIYDGLPPGMETGYVTLTNGPIVPRVSPFVNVQTGTYGYHNLTNTPGLPDFGRILYTKWAAILTKNGLPVADAGLQQIDDDALILPTSAFVGVPAGNSLFVVTRNNDTPGLMQTFFQEDEPFPFLGGYDPSLNLAMLTYFQHPYWQIIPPDNFGTAGQFYYLAGSDTRPILFRVSAANTNPATLVALYGDYIHYTILPKRRLNGINDGNFLGYCYRKQIVRIQAPDSSGGGEGWLPDPDPNACPCEWERPQALTNVWKRPSCH